MHPPTPLQHAPLGFGHVPPVPEQVLPKVWKTAGEAQAESWATEQVPSAAQHAPLHGEGEHADPAPRFVVPAAQVTPLM